MGPSEDEMEQAPLSKDDEIAPADAPAAPLELQTKPKPGKDGAPAPKKPQSSLGPRHLLAAPAPAPLLKVHFIDIGQGDATLVECPNGAKILVDFGSHTGGEASAKAYLREVLAGDAIDDLVVTHPDGDHYNRLHFGLDGIEVNEAWVVGRWADYSGTDNKASKEWLMALEQAGKLRHLDENGPYHDGDTPHPGFDCGAAEVWVAAAGVTGSNSGWRKNTMSIVLVVSYGEFDVVLTGDATTETEKQMIDWHCPEGWQPGDDCWLDSEVLKMGHHGSKATSTGQAFAAAVSPEVAIVSATRSKKHGHPGKDAVQRLEPHTKDHAGHKFLWWLDSNTPEFVDPYKETVYSTAVNRHIVVESDGSAVYRVRP